MSASEGAGGVMTPGRDSLAVAGLHNSAAQAPPQPQPQQVPQSVRLPYSADPAVVYGSASGSSQLYQTSGAGDASSGAGVVITHPKKRGRPRKYGQNVTMALTPSGGTLFPQPAVTSPPGEGTFSPPSAAPVQVRPPSQAAPSTSGGLGSPPPAKKGRGRPPGSGSGSGRKQHHQHQNQNQNQQQSEQQQVDALGSAGYGFMPHIIMVNAGEDLSSKIMSFSQHGPKDICVISANGSISNVTLRQSATSGGTATYEGRFEILSLSGSFLLTEVGGQRTRTGGLSVALTGPDGRVLGGSVAGLLIAASPVQVFVGSFIADGRKESKPVKNMDPSSAPLRVNPGGATGASSPPSRGTLSGSSGGPGSPLNAATGSISNNGLGMSSMPWK